MSCQDKSERIAAIISEMIEIKIREHDLKHRFVGDDEDARADTRQSLVDQSKFEANKVNLAVAIHDLCAR
jgi:hypothetical protein